MLASRYDASDRLWRSTVSSEWPLSRSAEPVNVAKTVFGDKMFDAWVDFKREEWLSYTNHVSDWEKERYLKFF